MATPLPKDQEKPTDPTIPRQPLEHKFWSNKDKKWFGNQFIDRVVVIESHLCSQNDGPMLFFLRKLKVPNAWLLYLEKRKIFKLDFIKKASASLIKYTDEVSPTIVTITLELSLVENQFFPVRQDTENSKAI